MQHLGGGGAGREGAEPSSEEPSERRIQKKIKDGTKNLKKEIDQHFTVSLATRSASGVEF